MASIGSAGNLDALRIRWRAPGSRSSLTVRAPTSHSRSPSRPVRCALPHSLELRRGCDGERPPLWRIGGAAQESTSLIHNGQGAGVIHQPTYRAKRRVCPRRRACGEEHARCRHLPRGQLESYCRGLRVRPRHRLETPRKQEAADFLPEKSLVYRRGHPNTAMDLTATIAAQGVLRPPCSLKMAAAHCNVGHTGRT